LCDWSYLGRPSHSPGREFTTSISSFQVQDPTLKVQSVRFFVLGLLSLYK
jgi:hypothetical protein